MREDADDRRAPFDLLVQALERVGAVETSLVLIGTTTALFAKGDRKGQVLSDVSPPRTSTISLPPELGADCPCTAIIRRPTPGAIRRDAPAERLPRGEPDVPLDARRRRIDADPPQTHRLAQVAPEGRVHVEELADLRPEHLRHRLTGRLRRAAASRPAADAFSEMADQLLQLGT